MKYRLKQFFYILIVTLVLSPVVVFAQAGTQLKNPLAGRADNLQQFIGLIIQGLLGIVGSIALIMFIYGGMLWMTAGGNDGQIKKGRDTLTWAVLGLVVIFASYTIVRFVFESLAGSI